MRKNEIWEKDIKTFLGETIHARINLTMQTDKKDTECVRISVRGNRNPFSFRDACIPRKDVNSISEFLHKDNWERASYSYVN